MKKWWICTGIILPLVLAFLFRFEIFFSYKTIENHSYRTNRITGETETFDLTRMLWLSQKDLINDRINELKKQIEIILENRESALARKNEIENSHEKDEPQGLFEQLNIESLEVNEDGLDAYQVNIEEIKKEIQELELQLQNL